MIKEILYSIVQSITEFLPISSDGHLALLSNFLSHPDLFFIIILHIASLFAVIIFLRKEIKMLLFDRNFFYMWKYIIIGIIPAGIFGFFFKDFIESTLSSFLLIGIFFMFNGMVLYLTKNSKEKTILDAKKSFLIGLLQSLALFPGISRSGMTISMAMFSGIKKEDAAKFSFLMFIPLSLGAFFLEIVDFAKGNSTLSIDVSSLIVSFFVCFVLSLVFVNLLTKIAKKGDFWKFSFYCFFLGIICILIYFFS